MDKNHELTPFFTKLVEYAESKTICHDVPGHKLGQIPNELMDFVGPNMFKLDANAPRGLDNLNRPTGVIKEAAELMADAFKAEKAYFLTGGTTMGILAMIMSVCRAKEKIILPRNVHKSAINALILSGAIPIFVQPYIDEELGIANHMDFAAVEKAILENPEAKAVFVINPTYFGVTSNLQKIVELAHEKEMMVLVDEAHGSHLPFSSQLPASSMEAGADMSSCSLHKTVGSLTQSSILITQGPRIDHLRLRSTINMIQSTSPSSLLLSSLDVARKHIYFEGAKEIPLLIEMAKHTREKINQIPGLKAMDDNYFVSHQSYDYDETKLLIKVSELGISGFDVYKELFDDHHIQLELAETHLVLAVLSVGTRQSDLDALVDALKKVSTKYSALHLPRIEPKVKVTFPEAYTRPREAYHAPKKIVTLSQAVDEIAAESIMIYPPGIPIVIPGEIISQDILDDLEFYQRSGSVILSDTEGGYVKIIDKEYWEKWSEVYEDE
ncbi:MAG: aminotransferase class I/II-fold pyridoxal phosphate-dependent enzyme [Acholeplasmataceae bacterium]|jgi:lysine decarboxylase|nr:aminotransferase class I/II-fold pyridoxal phosphate-dependent enzyme [Acholeplasmataceae bacterium]